MEFFNGVENIHWWTVILNGGRDYIHEVDTPFSVISSNLLDERSLGPLLKSLPLDCIRKDGSHRLVCLLSMLIGLYM